MPTYDYECKECGHEFEAFQTMSEEPLSTCPSCGEKSLRRLIGGGTGIIFRGSGFYINDSRSSKNGHNGASGYGNASGGKGASGKASDGTGGGKESGGSESSSGSSSESSSGSSSSESSSGNGAGSPKSA